MKARSFVFTVHSMLKRMPVSPINICWINDLSFRSPISRLCLSHAEIGSCVGSARPPVCSRGSYYLVFHAGFPTSILIKKVHDLCKQASEPEVQDLFSLKIKERENPKCQIHTYCVIFITGGTLENVCNPIPNGVSAFRSFTAKKKHTAAMSCTQGADLYAELSLPTFENLAQGFKTRQNSSLKLCRALARATLTSLSSPIILFPVIPKRSIPCGICKKR